MIFLQNTTDKSYKDRALFQTHQNLFQDFGFFPQHLLYSLFFCEPEKCVMGRSL